MTSNLRRFSGAQNNEHKIDISEASPTNNPKFCHKKIKVSLGVAFHAKPIFIIITFNDLCDTET